MKPDEHVVRQCGSCGAWTKNGDFFPSGNSNPRTGHTPLDNFLCRGCQRDESDARILRNALRGYEQRRDAQLLKNCGLTGEKVGFVG